MAMLSFCKLLFAVLLFLFSISSFFSDTPLPLFSLRKNKIKNGTLRANYVTRKLRPRPHVSGDFCIRKFFYADTPSVHTCPPYTLGVSGDFCIRSVYPEIFVYALQSGNFCIRCVSGYVWTLVSVYFCIR